MANLSLLVFFFFFCLDREPALKERVLKRLTILAKVSFQVLWLSSGTCRCIPSLDACSLPMDRSLAYFSCTFPEMPNWFYSWCAGIVKIISFRTRCMFSARSSDIPFFFCTQCILLADRRIIIFRNMVCCTIRP